MKLNKYLSFRKALTTPVLTLILSLIITYLAFNAAITAFNQKKQSYFNFRVREAVNLIHYRMQAYEHVLRGADGLYNASQNVDRNEFKQYVEKLNLADYYPGIRGVGFSVIVPKSKKSQHIASIRMEGFPEYTIKPKGERDVYSSIIYIEPFSDPNIQAFGYDMFSEPVRHAAMQNAIRSGKVTLSGKVKLVQKSGNIEQTGFLMYLPIYRSGTNNVNTSERLKHIVGWVYAPFRMDDLMAGLFGELSKDLDIQIFDGNSTLKEALMFDSNLTYTSDDQLIETLQLQIADHTWTIRIKSLPLINTRLEAKLPYLIAVIGVVISIMLSLLIWFLVTGRERAINAAKLMNSDLIAERQRLSNIIEGTQAGTWEWNVETGEVFFNEHWAKIIGYKLSELEPISIDTWLKFLHPDDAKISASSLEKHFSGELPYYECEVRMQHKDGRWIYVLDRGKVTEWAHSGKPIKMSGTHQDITSRKEAENELRIAATVFESQEGMYVTNAENVILRVNHAFTKITGYSAKDAVGKTPRLLSSGQHDKAFYAAMWECINNTGAWEGEIWNRRKDGEVYPQQLNITVVKDAANNLTNYIATLIDITDRNRLNAELKRQAHIDYLTGLSNRRYFMKQGELELSRALRYETPLSLMMLDIDFFKRVNDTYGHQVGDTVLQALSKVCLDTMRQVDIVGRLGGEEFAVILPETTITEALEVAERLRDAVAHKKVTISAGLPIHFTVSIGVTTLDEKSVNIDMLLNRADKAMYTAKETGRNKVCVG